nr:oligoendopeptidase F [Chloroflexota bacterium]
MTQATQALPHWDMTVVYPGLDSPEFEQGFNAITQDIGLLAELFDTHGIAKREHDPLDEDTVQTFETIIARYNEVLDETHVLIAYLYCLVSTDSRDDAAQARMSALQNQTMRLSQLGTRLTAWLGTLDVDSLVERSEIARAHGYSLRRAKVEAE